MVTSKQWYDNTLNLKRGLVYQAMKQCPTFLALTKKPGLIGDTVEEHMRTKCEHCTIVLVAARMGA